MTPDVSSVLALAEQCWIPAGSQQGDMARAELQQAAEQACYRYALSVLDAVAVDLPVGMPPKIGLMANTVGRLANEREMIKRQLIAGSV